MAARRVIGFVGGWTLGVVFTLVLAHLVTPVLAATLSRGQTFASDEQVTNTKLHNLVDNATISGIVQADLVAASGLALRQASAPTDTDAIWVDTSTSPPTVKFHDGSAWQIANVQQNSILLTDQASCPTGYTRISALDGKFLVGAATYSAAAGGADNITPAGTNAAESSHTHGIGGFVNATSSPNNNGCSGGSACPAADHTHVISGTSGAGSSHNHTFTGTSFDNRPAFANILICKKD